MDQAKRVLAAALAAAIFTPGAFAAPISSKLQKALDGLQGDPKIRILVQMKDAETTVFGAALSAGDSAGRLKRLSALRRNALADRNRRRVVRSRRNASPAMYRRLPG